MPFCAIKTCPNSKAIQFKKRAKMCCFPARDKQRCLAWIEYVRKENKKHDWTPTKNSAICEDHFSSNMWEPRTDLKKLKGNAIPGVDKIAPIVFDNKPLQIRSSFINRKIFPTTEEKQENKIINILKPNIVYLSDVISITDSNEINTKNDNFKSLNVVEIISDSEDENLITDLNFTSSDMNDKQIKLKKLLKLFDQSSGLKIRTEKKLKAAELQVKHLQEKVQNIQNFKQKVKILLLKDYGENILEAI